MSSKYHTSTSSPPSTRLSLPNQNAPGRIRRSPSTPRQRPAPREIQTEKRNLFRPASRGSFICSGLGQLEPHSLHPLFSPASAIRMQRCRCARGRSCGKRRHGVDQLSRLASDSPPAWPDSTTETDQMFHTRRSPVNSRLYQGAGAIAGARRGEMWWLRGWRSRAEEEKK
jgi:hypothetical protein